jgi:Family of unknown function (DUF5518)
MINRKAIVLGFIVTIVLAYIGNYIPYLDIPLAPIIGGVIAGLVVGGGYKNGIINGGLAAGIPGFIYTLIVIVYATGSTISTAVTRSLANTSYLGLSGIITVGIIIFGSILAFGIYFILGLIGGIIGVVIKDKISEN